jgi:hypothetical protein
MQLHNGSKLIKLLAEGSWQGTGKG